jgi:hypothetical protein
MFESAPKALFYRLFRAKRLRRSHKYDGIWHPG